jgi:extracellular elastinolytic metalloproteinase
MRHERIVVAACLSLAFSWAGCASDEQSPPAGGRARVHASMDGQPLTPPSSATAFAVAADFLAARGSVDPDTLRVASQRRADTGLTHVRLEQVVDGLRVAGAYAKAAVNDRGELVHLIDNLVAVDGDGVAPAAIDESRALAAAMREHGLPGAPALSSRSGNRATFAGGGVFYSEPTVERVAFADQDGRLVTGFMVETWTQRDNILLHTLVDGRDGRIASVESLTAYDRYNVFAIDPGKTAQAITAGPGAGNAQSPQGWLSGNQTTINIHGNNVSAYLDRDANNTPDAGGTAVTSGDFLTVANLGAQPTTAANRNVAVQNLFFLTNSLHDVLYSHGFNEAAGNFQVNNFGRGGAGNDPVRAEAEDGSGTNNANFSTPADGTSGRMQMFLWDAPGGGASDHQVVVNSPSTIAGTLPASGAAFGPALNAAGITGGVVLVNDGAGAASDGCTAIQNAVSGRIALIDRGTCTFVVKVTNAQNAGAVAVIVANNADDTTFAMGGTSAAINIPSVMVGLTSGARLRSVGNVNATARRAAASVMLDGDLDSDVVYHEGCHGLSQRMIGGMNGRLAGAIGEGMSDVCSVILNHDDVVGEYVIGDPAGIRTAPYHNYPRTYGDIAGTEVHLDGEVYGAIGWRLVEIFDREGLSSSLLLDYIVDGMNFTPSTPAFEDMREGILQAVANRGLGHECLIWEAFAQFGVGVGADGAVVGGGVRITESFALPAQCQ